MIIAHSLVQELGERRTNTILAMLEDPELELAPSDRAAFDRFLQQLESQYGSRLPAYQQLSHLRQPHDECPEPP